MSYLRGPLTLPEISRLMAPRKAAAAAAQPSASRPQAAPPAAASSRPIPPAGVAELFLPTRPGAGPVIYRPRVAVSAKLHYVQAKSGLDRWRPVTLIAPFSDNDEPLWSEALETVDPGSGGEPAEGAGFAALPVSALREKSYSDWASDLKSHLYEKGALEVLSCAELKLASEPGESEGDFRARLAHALHEKRDEEVARLRDRYASKLQTLADQQRRAEDRVEREQSQLSQRKLDTMVSVGASVLGAIFGGRRSAAGRAGTAARTAGRVFSEKGDVARAGESLEVLRERYATLVREVEVEAEKLAASLDPDSIMLERISLTPRKSDIALGDIRLAWEPWHMGADGFPAPAWQA
jgi:hypothetical protein